MFRDLCSVRIYFRSSISSMSCQSLSNLRFIHRSRNQLFPQLYDSCLQSRSDPSPSPLSSQSSPPCIRLDILNVFTISSIHSNPFPSSPLPFSRLHFVFVSISLMSSLRYRRYILIRPLHVSQPSPPSYSSRYIQCLPYNIADTL
jgi:hypothetical protein